MTDSDLRELDGWIAEKFMGWRQVSYEPPVWTVGPNNRIVSWDYTSFGDPFRPSTLPSAFALVKREIERRGWGWACYSYPGQPRFTFEVLRDHWLEPDRGRADTEELAGCLAVKAAVEGSDAHPDQAKQD